MSEPLTSPQLSDALREHAAATVKHAARSHVLLMMAADMLKAHRAEIARLSAPVSRS